MNYHTFLQKGFSSSLFVMNVGCFQFKAAHFSSSWMNGVEVKSFWCTARMYLFCLSEMLFNLFFFFLLYFTLIAHTSERWSWETNRLRHQRYILSLEGNLESWITTTPNSPKEKGHPALCGHTQTRDGGDWDWAKDFGFHYIFFKE